MKMAKFLMIILGNKILFVLENICCDLFYRNCFIETVQMRGLNKCFYADLQANLSNPTTSLTEEDGRVRQVVGIDRLNYL